MAEKSALPVSYPVLRDDVLGDAARPQAPVVPNAGLAVPQTQPKCQLLKLGPVEHLRGVGCK
jgi:hypothetical protein